MMNNIEKSSEGTRSIFRKEAVAHYIREQEKAVSPPFISRRVVVLCWTIFVVLCALGAWLGTWKIPVYVSGSGMLVVPERENGLDRRTRTSLVALLPPETHCLLAAGRPIQLKAEDQTQWRQLTITDVAPEVMSAEKIKQIYRLPERKAGRWENGAAVAVICPGPGSWPFSSARMCNTMLDVRIEKESRRFASFFPLITSMRGKSS